MSHQQETTREHVQALAQKVKRERERIAQSRVDKENPLLRVKGAMAALEAIKRDLEDVASGLWYGAIVTLQDGLRHLYKKWKKLEGLDLEKRRDEWDHGHDEAIRWCLPDIEDLIG